MSAKRIKSYANSAWPRNEATRAWWYENARSIDVYVRIEGNQTLTLGCRIQRAKLADWLKRTEK